MTAPRPLLYRSKLFVHGCEPDTFGSAFASEADSVVLNNEDHVEPGDKEASREAIAAFLADPSRARGKVVQVRVNEVSSPYFQADIEAFVRPGVHVVNIPKVESLDEIRLADAAIARLEKSAGISAPIGLLVNIESAAGFRRAAELASGGSRVVGLQIGYGDLLRPLGIDYDGPASDMVRLAVRFAASEAGISSFDGAYLGDPTDLVAYRRDALRAVSFGMTGKSCNSPAQAAIANEVFPAYRQQRGAG